MGMGITWDKEKFKQEEEVKEQLEEIRDRLCEQITTELDSIFLQIQQLAIEICPKDTGALASSISLTGGAISAGNEFYQASISAGDPSIVNPKSGKGTDEYASLVHDGHTMRDGMFWSGVAFLEDAMAAFENELENCVTKGLAELTSGMND
ncbi:hypothetical protein MUP77_12325 [Candidatus Bathyarchaeota archaeon]|nr:hypothetical protein [Candidatus Bathyarchaeota archaeon]